MMRRLGLWTLMAVVVIAFNASSAEALSLPGSSLDAAEKEDFFQFFHLKKRAIDERDDLATHYFRPPSRDDVVVCVDTNKSGIILQMSLIVGRDFIDEPLTNIFARDLVKSFIEAATPASGSAETSSVVNEIFLRGSKLTSVKIKSVELNENTKEDAAKTGARTESIESPDSVTEKNTIVSTAKSNRLSGNENGMTLKFNDKKGITKVGTGDLKKGDAIILSDSLPKIPEKVSDPFRAFQGTLENVDIPITGAHLILKNHAVAKGRFLEVRVDLDSVKKEPKLEVVVDEAPSKDDDPSPNDPASWSNKSPSSENGEAAGSR